MQLYIDSDRVLKNTGKALLIKLPDSEMTFWHPVKCITYTGISREVMALWFNDTWIIRAKETHPDDFNYVVDKWTGTAEEMRDAFELCEDLETHQSEHNAGDKNSFSMDELQNSIETEFAETKTAKDVFSDMKPQGVQTGAERARQLKEAMASAKSKTLDNAKKSAPSHGFGAMDA